MQLCDFTCEAGGNFGLDTTSGYEKGQQFKTKQLHSQVFATCMCRLAVGTSS